MLARLHPLRFLVRLGLLGAALGLALFALETGLLLRAGLVGIDVEVEGPYAALMAAVRPLVPGLLARVAVR